MNTRKFSKKQENYVAKKFNGKVQPNSGATPFMKGDVLIGNDWLVECKTQTTNKKSISIKKEWFDKLEEERFAMRKPNSVLAFNFGPDEEMYYVVSEKMFKEIVRSTQNE